MATKELADSLPTRALASALARSPARRIGLPGQAFMEMALGMLALALVLASLFGFTSYILSSLEMQRDLRADAGRGALEAGGGDESYSSKTAHDVVEVELRDDIVDFVHSGDIPDDYTEDDYEYDSDIINNMYDVIVNGR